MLIAGDIYETSIFDERLLRTILSSPRNFTALSQIPTADILYFGIGLHASSLL